MEATRPCLSRPPGFVASRIHAAPGFSAFIGTVACHAEGRGFESLHPLRETRWKRRVSSYLKFAVTKLPVAVSQLLVSLQGAIAASLITTDQLITRPPTGAGSGPSEPQAAYVSAFIPRSLRERLEESARANDRSISGEVRMALRQYFADSSGVPPTPSELRLPEGSED